MRKVNQARQSLIFQMPLDGGKVKVEIYDTPGQVEFKTFRDSIIEDAKGFLVVYAVDNAQSFTEARDIITEMLLPKQRPIHFVGNKAVGVSVEPLRCRIFPMLSQKKTSKHFAINTTFPTANAVRKWCLYSFCMLSRVAYPRALGRRTV